MDRDITKLHPQIVWEYFYQITQIPRPSKKEDKIRAYLIAIAHKMGLEYTITDIGNVIIRKKATDTDIKRKKIILQAHMDMVPAKTKESTHNFATDPIVAYIDGEWVTADGTTLGADNGMGIACALAVLGCADIRHNDLEVLLTCDEEAGMSGALGMYGNELNGEILLNLDSEDDKEVCIGCAGGINTNIYYPITHCPATSHQQTLKIELKGLFSGHSGVDIPLGRANAVKEMAYLLLELELKFGYQLVSISGGKLRNVIPGYCEAYITVSHQQVAGIKNFIQQYEYDLQQEFTATDANLLLTITDSDDATMIIAPECSRPFIYALSSAFNGVWRMNNKLGIAETSSNIGVVSTHEDHLEVITLQRSALYAAKMKVANSIAAAFRQIGARIEHADDYPGWQPNFNSPALRVVKQVYNELFNEEIHVGATHGGLECGLILDKFPHLDAISIGATICFPHSPNEKVNIKSVAKSWQLLTHLIEKL